MAFRDLLLNISTYPEPTPLDAIDRAVELCVSLGGVLSALALTVKIPLRSNRAADLLVGIGAIAREEEEVSRRTCAEELAHFVERAKAAGVLGGTWTAEEHLYDAADRLVVAARTRDLCLIALGSALDGQVSVAQNVIFGSGRPVLLFRPDSPTPAGGALRSVVVAWDGSRCAARAMADAMPILLQASNVRLLSVTPEPSKAASASTLEALRYLKAHNVTATVHEATASGRSVGAALEGELNDSPPDLLVMGAYGHSKLRELILGGATEHLMRSARVPIFLSH
ncbi:MAG TPA: universal stress protein [Phenylobacterium sp.]|nr:universal stress protein [Phenylobacterium sp.]